MDVAGIGGAFQPVYEQQRKSLGAHLLRLPMAMAKHAAAIDRVHLDSLRIDGKLNRRPGKKVSDDCLQVTARKAAAWLKLCEPPRSRFARIVNHCVVFEIESHGML